jgi:L-asparaginase/Glu-tRNA(Gln) amidotransferase subunit D
MPSRDSEWFYEAGKALTDLGAVLGQDMTLECCYAKLSYLLGKGYSTDKIKKMLVTSLRGSSLTLRGRKTCFLSRTVTL